LKTPLRQRLVRATLAYALLVGGLPVLQSAAFIPGGWTESRVLMAVFVLGPLLAAWLVHKGLARPGAILALGFMSSGVIVNGLLLEQIRPPEFAAPHWIVVLRVWILVLMVVNVLLAWTAFQVLREVHRTSPPHAEPPSA
jgi:hypothetical protein